MIPCKAKKLMLYYVKIRGKGYNCMNYFSSCQYNSTSFDSKGLSSSGSLIVRISCVGGEKSSSLGHWGFAAVGIV